MYGKHVTRELSAYCHGELPTADSRRVSEHLLGCSRCRKEFEAIKFGVRLAEHLPRSAAPDSLWEKIEASLPKKFAAPSAIEPRQRRRFTLPFTDLAFALTRGWPRAAAASFAALLLVGFSAALWYYVRPSGSAWEVASLAGAPTIGSERVSKSGRLAVGEWLETDTSSRARINVANIGQVEIEPGTRVRLVETRLTEHRLELARGRLHALIFAPPRLFFVNTPSAVAADLGCAYTLEVDDRGRSLLHVTSGWVALELNNRESIVPAGAACETRPQWGPGTPYFTDASETFLRSLLQFDFEGGGSAALAAVVAEARARDTLTLWHLLSRVAEADRSRVYERLARLAPPPAGVTRDGVLRLDQEMLNAWRTALESVWLQESAPALRKAWRSIWK